MNMTPYHFFKTLTNRLTSRHVRSLRMPDIVHQKSGKGKTERGFTLLLAALISSVVLSLGAAIYGLAVKELQLSSLGRDSQYAFFAADTGAECALYWDVRYGYFATTSPATVVSPNPQCAEQAVTVSGRSAVFPYTMTFQIEPSGYCTIVTVRKTQNMLTGVISTLIHADGYSASCANYATSDRALQRSVELHY